MSSTNLGAQPHHRVRQVQDSLISVHLQRAVKITLLIPHVPTTDQSTYPLLLVHDGQDFPALKLRETVEDLLRQQRIPPLVVVGVHANEGRLQEYGTAHQPDYDNRGRKAGYHTQFVLKELLPYLESKYPVTTSAAERVVAGFSLSGLMALDLAWNHPDIFSKVGVFSGALWWRRRAFGKDYQDSDRIMHRQIREGTFKPDLKFWFQTGTLDETDDRDEDGVIDSIDDTLDCVAELERKGYRWGKDVQYVEVEGGEHNPKTWGKIMPEFLKWIFLKY
ncbi:esterase family protein [Telluribacter sp. SYSU D00476]|uniref:alpha/beta hydrolase n=1 Tax=Telluribacter sp. SYSU D00476 TaxID=2811430 RepID=UPI001FF3A86A|nr:alpha/beta hydrolase-fold protein [Telluribacter sp. SYSU D00476]